MNEQHIEELLKKLPNVEDHRDPQIIYQNVSLQLKRRHRRHIILPSFATAAILLLSVWLLPSLLDRDQYSTENSSEDKASFQAKEEKQINVHKKEDDKLPTVNENKRESKTVQKDNLDENSYTAVYNKESVEHRILTYPIPDKDKENVVYISVVEPEEKGKTLFEQYVETMDQLDEEKWGLSDYYPIDGELSLDEENKVLQVSLPGDHPYGNGSATEMMFFQVINDTANLFGAKKAELFTDGQPGAFFGNSGDLDEIPVESEGNHAYYFYKPKGIEVQRPFLVASEETYEDISTALEAMKQSPDQGDLDPSIPNEFIIHKVQSEDPRVLVIQLDDHAQLESNNSMIHSIEAILLTAKDFNYDQVRIENANIDQVGKFHFNENWDVPIAPNKVNIDK